MNTRDIIGKFLGSATLITDYKIVDDFIYIHFVNNEEYSIPYTVEHEKNLLLMMQLQNENQDITYINIQFLKQVVFLGMSVMLCVGGAFAFYHCVSVFKALSFLMFLCNARNIGLYFYEIFEIFQLLDGIQKNYEFLENKGVICKMDEYEDDESVLKISEEVVLQTGMSLSSDLLGQYRDLRTIIGDISVNENSEKDMGKVFVKK